MRLSLVLALTVGLAAACNSPVALVSDASNPLSGVDASGTAGLDAATATPSDAASPGLDAAAATLPDAAIAPDAAALPPDAAVTAAHLRVLVQSVDHCNVDPPATPGLSRVTPTASRIGVVGLDLMQSRFDPSPVHLSLASALVEVNPSTAGGALVGEGDVPAGTYRFLRFSLAYGSVTIPATAHQGAMSVSGTLEFDIATATHTASDGHLRPAGELVARFASVYSNNSYTATVQLDCPLSEAGGLVETGAGTHHITVPVPGGSMVAVVGGSTDLLARFPLAGAVTWLDLATAGYSAGVVDITGTPTGSETPARLPICDLLLSDRCEADAAPNHSAPAWPMPDSADTTCTDGTIIAACPASGAAGWGQDGNYSVVPPHLVAGTDTVEDTVTGLVWQRVPAPDTYDWWGARAYCAALDLGGRQDWTLPSRLELASILDVLRFPPSIDLVAFPGLGASEFFWTNSPALFSSLAFGIRFDEGFVYDHDPKSPGHVRCVAGGRLGPASRMTLQTDTALDAATGLTWQRGWQPATTWLAALAACESLTLAGQSDWRLPTLKELLTIVEDTALSPSTDVAAFPNTPAEWFWASTPGMIDSNYGQTVSFTDGFCTPAAGTQLYLSRCVRGP